MQWNFFLISFLRLEIKLLSKLFYWNMHYLEYLRKNRLLCPWKEPVHYLVSCSRLTIKKSCQKEQGWARYFHGSWVRPKNYRTETCKPLKTQALREAIRLWNWCGCSQCNLSICMFSFHLKIVVCPVHNVVLCIFSNKSPSLKQKWYYNS